MFKTNLSKNAEFKGWKLWLSIISSIYKHKANRCSGIFSKHKISKPWKHFNQKGKTLFKCLSDYIKLRAITAIYAYVFCKL